MQNRPAGMVKDPWPADTYGIGRTDDWGAAYAERKEIYDLVRDAKITGFAIVSGDRHAFCSTPSIVRGCLSLFGFGTRTSRNFNSAGGFPPSYDLPASRAIIASSEK